MVVFTELLTLIKFIKGGDDVYFILSKSVNVRNNLKLTIWKQFSKLLWFTYISKTYKIKSIIN